MKPSMKDIVNRADWQKLRKELLGTWKHSPKENIKKLIDFIGDFKSTEIEKLKIVMNYLTGTGFRTGRIKHPSIQRLRSEISIELKKRKMNEQ